MGNYTVRVYYSDNITHVIRYDTLRSAYAVYMALVRRREHYGIVCLLLSADDGGCMHCVSGPVGRLSYAA